MTSEEVPPVKAAYKAWLRAAEAAAGGKGRGGRVVVKQMQRYMRREHLLIQLKAESDWVKAESGTVRGPDGRVKSWESSLFATWAGRGSAPREDAVRKALVVAVTALVGSPPAGAESWSSFEHLFSERIALSRGGKVPSGRIAKENARAKKEEDDRLLLAVDPGPAAHLDAAALGLGSGMLDGGVPRYLERTVDTKIVRHLDGGSPGLTVIVGPPKAGKSRGIVEVLRSHLPDAVTWWVDSSPHTAPAVRERLSKSPAPPSVIVFDDAHLNGVNPTTGLSAELLRRLEERARIVLIVHNTEVNGWVESVSAGASHQLLVMLNAARVDYPIDLDAQELEAASRQFDADAAVLARLGEHFASVADAPTEVGLGVMIDDDNATTGHSPRQGEASVRSLTRPLPLLADSDDPDSVLQVVTVREQTIPEPLLGSDWSGETSAAIGPSGDVVAALVDGILVSGWIGDDMRADAEFAQRFDGHSLKILAIRSRSGSGIEMALSDSSGTFLAVREIAGTWSEPVRIAGVGTLAIAAFLDEGFLGCEPNGRGIRGRSAAVLPSTIWKHIGTVTGMDVVVLNEYEGVALWGLDPQGEPVGMVLTHLRTRGSTWNPTVLPGALQVSLARRKARRGRPAPEARKLIRFVVRNRDGSYTAEAGPLEDALARRGEIKVDA